MPGLVHWTEYPFAANPSAHARELTGYALTTTPPTLWRSEPREVLFVPAGQKDEMLAWCAENGVPRIEPEDVWELLLEPFLDTVHSEPWRQRTRKQLEHCGFTEQEVEQLRARFREPMLGYNSVLWDWVCLGQFDLLQAAGPGVYWESMAIAWRGLESAR